MGSQYRLLIGDWYDERPGIRAGDTITFRKNNGIMMVSLQPDRKVVQANKSAADKLPAIKKKVIDLIVDAFAQIETGGLAARVTVRDTGISVEWGDNIKSTEITFCNTKGTI